MEESIFKPWKEVVSLGDGDKSIVYLSPGDIDTLPGSDLSKMDNYDIACLVSDNNTVGASQISVFGPITIKSYVQDGLVAMWDGIENGGYGIHYDELPNNIWRPCVNNTIWGNDEIIKLALF